MNMNTILHPSRLFALAMLCAALAIVLGCNTEAPPPPPEPAKAVSVGDNITLEEQGDRRRVRLNAVVTRRSRDDPGYEGFTGLEFFLTNKAGGKSYESILTADVNAAKVHQALVRAKAVPGSPVRFEPEFRSPRGQTIQVTLQYEQGGQQHTVSAKSWLSTKSGKPVEFEWVFAGSQVMDDPLDIKAPKRYLAQTEGSLITLGNLESAMLDVTLRSSHLQADIDLDFNSERIPPIDTKVTVILEPVGEYRPSRK
jgi:hypothetical protein